jgi:hypothetical protein
MSDATVQVGDQFADVDPRIEEIGGRVVKVIEQARDDWKGRKRFLVEVVQHGYGEAHLGRRSLIQEARLLSSAYRKVSR